MTLGQKVKDVLMGLGMILLSVTMSLDPAFGFSLVSVIISVSLLYLGIKSLIYYQTMARHMVGGRMQLYRGIILFDLGLFAMSLDEIPKIYVGLYLIGIHLFAGIVDVLRARESKMMENPSWKNSMLSGLINIVMVIACLVFGVLQNRVYTLVYIYAAGLAYSGIVKIINAFKKTAVIYIQ